MTAAEFKRKRTQLDLTQAQLADLLGMTRDAISSMEMGRRPIVKTTELALEHLFCKRRKK